MVFVYSCIYYHNKDHEINMHIFENFDQACQIVAEVWVHELGNVYTIVDEGGSPLTLLLKSCKIIE